METRLESEFFKTFINFLALLAKKLRPKIKKLLNYLIIGLIINFVVFRSFWTRNSSKSSKVSIGSGFSLVSNKNLSEILPSSSLGLRPDEVGQKGLKQLHLWHYSQNT